MDRIAESLEPWNHVTGSNEEPRNHTEQNPVRCADEYNPKYLHPGQDLQINILLEVQDAQGGSVLPVNTKGR